jgi:hypothetical protein
MPERASSDRLRMLAPAPNLENEMTLEGTMLQTNADMEPAEIRKFCPIDENRTRTHLD